MDPRISAAEAIKIHQAAVSRDYVIQPRLGKLLMGSFLLDWP